MILGLQPTQSTLRFATILEGTFIENYDCGTRIVRQVGTVRCFVETTFDFARTDAMNQRRPSTALAIPAMEGESFFLNPIREVGLGAVMDVPGDA